MAVGGLFKYYYSKLHIFLQSNTVYTIVHMSLESDYDLSNNQKADRLVTQEEEGETIWLCRKVERANERSICPLPKTVSVFAMTGLALFKSV